LLSIGVDNCQVIAAGLLYFFITQSFRQPFFRPATGSIFGFAGLINARLNRRAGAEFIKCMAALLLAAPAAIGQTNTASVAGTVADAKSQKPIPAAIVMAIRADAPPLSKTTRSGGDGAFKIDNLPAGRYSLCVQAPGDMWLDPCQWNGTPAGILLASGQAATGVSLRLAAASVLNVQVKDTLNVLKGKTKQGTQPHLAIGVWGPQGLYYPARAQGSQSATENPHPAGNSEIVYTWRLAIPRDIPLKLHVSSKDLRLGDGRGASLAGNAIQQTFQHATGDANPKSFAFTLLGLTP